MLARGTRLVIFLAVVAAAANAFADYRLPVVNGISPSAVSAGSGGFTLTVTGKRFNRGDNVTWNGARLSTILLNNYKAQAQVPATAVATAGTANVGMWDSSTGSYSNAVTFTITQSVTSPPISACTVGSTSWSGKSLGIGQLGSFSASFDATPQASGTDANVAFSQNLPAAYTDLGVIVRFSPSGIIDVRNGSNYAANYNQAYSANSTYHFLVAVNVPAHTYSVYVTPPGGTQQTLASNYAFRSEQASDTSLNYWTTYQDPGSAGPVQVCNFSLGTAPAPSVVAVAVSPTSASMPAGGTKQFTSSVSGTANTAVTWSATGGTISSTGLYTAPSTACTQTVKAVSAADPTKSATATVSVSAPVTVGISVAPASATTTTNGMAQFSATVTGTSNTAVTWSATGGAISSTGLYTAPSTVGTYTVKAVSGADPTKSASATATVTARVSVSISPNNTSTTTSGQVQLSAAVTGATNTAVTWSVASGGGTVSTSGLYTAPNTAGSATVRATSVADPSSSALAYVTVSTPVTMLLSASPTSISFGSVVVGGSISRPVTLTNTGNSAVTVSSASTTGSGFGLSGLSFPFTVAANSSQTANVAFAPSSSGTATGTVSFVSNATTSPATVALSGSGTAPLPHSVTLAWQASTSSVSGYNVYRSLTNGGSYGRLNSALDPSSSFVDSSVQSGQIYYYVVTTVDSTGAESGYSNQVAAVIPTP